MKRLKKLSTVVTIVALLALPMGIMGCAKATPPADAPGATDADAGADAETESELGEPEGSTNL